jgi:hypothetical protein
MPTLAIPASPVSLRELLVLKAEELGIYILRGENWENPTLQHKNDIVNITRQSEGSG